MKHVIWQNINIRTDDWTDFLKEEHPEVTDEYEQYDLICEENDFQLDCEKENLNIELGSKIVIIADLGLWFGRRSAYKILDETNLRECLRFSPDCDYAEWFVEDGNFQSTQVHHDGRNRYTYRAIREDLSQDDLFRLEDEIISTKELMQMTRSLAPEVCKVFGWEVDSENIPAYN